MVAEREQRRDVAAGAQPDVAAPAAVAAVGPAARHVRLATERDTARAAVATLHVALRYVDEAGHPDRIRTMPPAPGRISLRSSRCAGRDGRLMTTVAVWPRLVLVRRAAVDADDHRPSPPRRRPRPRPRPRADGRRPSRSATTSTATVAPTTTRPRRRRCASCRSRARRRPSQCNAPTQVQLHWETQDATSVDAADQRRPVFATYPSGTHDPLVPLTCDGNTQTYTLTARGQRRHGDEVTELAEHDSPA